MFLSLVLQNYRIPVCAQLLVMIVIAGRLSLLGFVFKPVSWLAGDSRLRQTFCLRIHLVEWQSLSSICPSTIISYLRSLEASLSTSASRSITGPIVFSLDRNKPVTITNKHVCLTRGLPSTPFDLLYNTPRSVACTLLRSTICTEKSILIVRTGSLDKEESAEFTELDCATLIEIVEMLAWVAEPDGGGTDTSPRKRAQSQHTR